MAVKVMKAVSSASIAYIEKDLGSDQSEVWATFDLRPGVGAVALWEGFSGEVLVQLYNAAHDLQIRLLWVDSSPGWADDIGDFGNVPPPTDDVWQTCELRQVNGGVVEFYVGGTLVFAGTDNAFEDVRYVQMGLTFGNFDAANVAYYRNVKFGTTRGASDLFSDDFASGDLSAWTSTSGDVSVIDTPFSPAPPTLVSATPGRERVMLRWTQGDEGGSEVTGFRIYRGTTTGGETLFVSIGVADHYSDNLADAGTEYFYKVSAVNAIGESALSNELSATPYATILVPIVKRKRFLSSKISQALTIKFVQNGPSDVTEIHLVELAARPLDPAEAQATNES